MKLNQTQLSKGYTQYGSQMGRQNTIPYRDVPVKLNMIKLGWIDGDYDFGGAYFGNTGRDNIYWAKGEYISNFECFVRAQNRIEAKQKVKELIPNAKFYN